MPLVSRRQVIESKLDTPWKNVVEMQKSVHSYKNMNFGYGLKARFQRFCRSGNRLETRQKSGSESETSRSEARLKVAVLTRDQDEKMSCLLPFQLRDSLF